MNVGGEELRSRLDCYSHLDPVFERGVEGMHASASSILRVPLGYVTGIRCRCNFFKEGKSYAVRSARVTFHLHLGNRSKVKSWPDLTEARQRRSRTFFAR